MAQPVINKKARTATPISYSNTGHTMVCYNAQPVATVNDEDSDDIYGYNNNEGLPAAVAAANQVDCYFGYKEEEDGVEVNQHAAGEELGPQQRPKRRCSITKYSLEESATTPLDAACIIRNLRNGISADGNNNNNTTHLVVEQGPNNIEICGCASERRQQQYQDPVHKAKTSYPEEESNTDAMADSTSMSTADVMVEAVVVKQVAGADAVTKTTTTTAGTATTDKKNSVWRRFLRRARRAHVA